MMSILVFHELNQLSLYVELNFYVELLSKRASSKFLTFPYKEFVLNFNLIFSQTTQRNPFKFSLGEFLINIFI